MDCSPGYGRNLLIIPVSRAYLSHGHGPSGPGASRSPGKAQELLHSNDTPFVLVLYDAFIWKGLGKGAALSAEENKAVVRRMIEEVWNDHDFTNFEEVVAENHFDHMAVPEHQRGVVGERHVMEWLLTVFPDHRFDIEDAAADGGRRLRCAARAVARTRASSGASRRRAKVSPSSSRTGSASWTARWRSTGRSGTISLC
jgi:SnoaL-like polyketide cyclase